jgi:hypothetical protein
MKKDRSRDRTRVYRERKKEKQETAAEERAIRDHLWYFGEVSPRLDARTHAEELAIHREFLRALGEQDLQPGETLRQVAKRTYEAWLAFYGFYDGTVRVAEHTEFPRYVPGFNRISQKFDEREGFGVGPWSDEMWVAPADCANGEADQPIDINDLPKLPKLDVKKIRSERRIAARES